MPRKSKHLPEELKSELKRRAGYKCEYCHKTILDQSWEIEHIKPQSLGGYGTLDNLAFACKRCNLNKREHTHYIDRSSGLIVTLFNPRKDSWDEHFGLSEGYVVGRTSIGRATASLLFRSTSQHLPDDLGWWPIQSLKSETLYRYLNEQRVRRLTNQFTSLEKEVRSYENYEILRQATPRDQYLTRVALHLLKIELCMMRSREEDIREGIEVTRQLLRTRPPKWIRIELHHLLSILLQQLATIYALAGKHQEALKLQNQSSHSYNLVLSHLDDIEIHERLRRTSLATKYDGKQSIFYNDEDLREAINQTKEGHLKAITYLADDELRLAKRSRFFDRVLGVIDEALEKCGYGQDFDYARTIVLRRRWWALKLIANDVNDLDLLAKDVNFWKSIKMYNEIRELYLLIEQVNSRSNTKRATQMMEVISIAAKRT